MNDSKRIKNMFEIMGLRASNRDMISKFMATADKEEAAGMLKEIKSNAARISELEKEQCQFAFGQIINTLRRS